MEINIGSEVIVKDFNTGAIEVFIVKSIFYCIDSSEKESKDKKAFLVSNYRIERLVFENQISSIAVPYKDKK